MKKRRNIVAAFLLSSVMAVSACAMSIPAMTAFAADVTVTFKQDTIARTYEVYQIFTGSPQTDGTLTELAYGTGIDQTKVPTAYADAQGLAGHLESLGADPVSAANELAGYLSSTKTTVTSSTSADVTQSFAEGYYLIKDVTAAATVANNANSRYILKVVKPVDINPKRDFPTIDKKIGTDYSTGTKANAVSVGDTVPFVLQSAVPDMTGYNKYYFVINDDMCDGLTFDPASAVTVTIGSKTLTRKTAETTGNEWFEVQTGVTADGHTLQIVFNDFIQYAALKDETITVKYSAVLNENADRTVIGNPNTVDLTYSNNPNTNYSGGTATNPNEPTSGEPVGETPESKTKTYTTELKLKKVDDSTPAKPLTGAEFKIACEDSQKVIVVKLQEFEEDNTSGTYYKLANGTYTKTASTTDTAGFYDIDASGKKFKLKNTTTQQTENTDANHSVTATVDSNGHLIFAGLGEGNYTITETKAPDGYNKITPFTVNVSAAFDTSQNVTWTFKKNNADTITQDTDGFYSIEVVNNKGTTLPETGGIGTTIFYIIGGTLMAGAVVLLITKKRMTYTDEK